MQRSNHPPVLHFEGHVCSSEPTTVAVKLGFCSLTLVPVQAATTSWIVHGVTITMKPKDMAAIVRDALVLSLLSWATSCRQKVTPENPLGLASPEWSGLHTPVSGRAVFATNFSYEIKAC